MDSFLVLRPCNTLRFSSFHIFQKPCHVLRQRPHGLQTFLVLTDILRCEAVYLIPVLRTDNVHIADTEIFVQAVKGCAGSTTATGYHRCCQLSGHPGLAAKEQSVKKSAELTRRTGVVNRGTYYDTIVFIQLFQYLIHFIVKDSAARLLALHTSDTASNLLFAEV